MTVPSDNFVFTMNKKGGDLRIRRRSDNNAPAFAVERAHIAELIGALQSIRDEHGPKLDKYGDEEE